MDDLSVTAVTKESTCTECNALKQYSGKFALGHRLPECRVHRVPPAGNSPKRAASEDPAFLCREALLQDSLRTSSYPVFLEPRTSSEVLVTSHTGKPVAVCSGYKLRRVLERESVSSQGSALLQRVMGPGSSLVGTTLGT